MGPDRLAASHAWDGQPRRSDLGCALDLKRSKKIEADVNRTARQRENVAVRNVTTGRVLALLVGVCWFVPDSDRVRLPVRLHAGPVESVDASPFGITEHRRPPRPTEKLAAGFSMVPASLAATIEQLKATGDPRDAYKAFRLIANCVRARELDDEMNALPLGPEFAAERRAYGDGRQRLRDACQDITTAQIAGRLPLVEKAARAGVPGAVTARIGEGPFGDRTALEQRPDDPLVTEWVEQSIASVKAAARRDDIEAILQLALLALYWELDEIDKLKTLVQHASGPTLRDPEGRLFAMSRRTPMRADSNETTATPFGKVE